MISSVVDAVLEYCGREETQAALDAKVARPLLARAREFVGRELGWVVRALQALGAVMALQTLLLLWVVWAVLRLPAAF